MTDVKTVLGLTPEQLKNTRPAVIDGDSFAYIIGYNHREFNDVDAVIANVDDFLHSICQAVQTRLIVGVLNPRVSYVDLMEGTTAILNFRHSIAVTKPYKGNRGAKPDWYIKWQYVIEDRLIEHWGFKRVPDHLEADDVVAALMTELNGIEACTPICCGCDKDLAQIPGHHYNYKNNLPKVITHDEALYNLFTQVMLGDSTDNIPGLEGTGKVGAARILSSEGVDSQSYHISTLYAFCLKLGIDKGIQSFHENYMLCALRKDADISEFVLKSYDLDAGATRQMFQGEPKISESLYDPDLLDDEGLFRIEE